MLTKNIQFYLLIGIKNGKHPLDASCRKGCHAVALKRHQEVLDGTKMRIQERILALYARWYEFRHPTIPIAPSFPGATNAKTAGAYTPAV